MLAKLAVKVVGSDNDNVLFLDFMNMTKNMVKLLSCTLNILQWLTQ